MLIRWCQYSSDNSKKELIFIFYDYTGKQNKINVKNSHEIVRDFRFYVINEIEEIKKLLHSYTDRNYSMNIEFLFCTGVLEGYYINYTDINKIKLFFVIKSMKNLRKRNEYKIKTGIIYNQTFINEETLETDKVDKETILKIIKNQITKTNNAQKDFYDSKKYCLSKFKLEYSDVNNNKLNVSVGKKYVFNNIDFFFFPSNRVLFYKNITISPVIDNDKVNVYLVEYNNKKGIILLNKKALRKLNRCNKKIYERVNFVFQNYSKRIEIDIFIHKGVEIVEKEYNTIWLPAYNNKKERNLCFLVSTKENMSDIYYIIAFTSFFVEIKEDSVYCSFDNKNLYAFLFDKDNYLSSTSFFLNKFDNIMVTAEDAGMKKFKVIILHNVEIENRIIMDIISHAISVSMRNYFFLKFIHILDNHDYKDRIYFDLETEEKDKVVEYLSRKINEEINKNLVSMKQKQRKIYDFRFMNIIYKCILNIFDNDGLIFIYANTSSGHLFYVFQGPSDKIEAILHDLEEKQYFAVDYQFYYKYDDVFLDYADRYKKYKYKLYCSVI